MLPISSLSGYCLAPARGVGSAHRLLPLRNPQERCVRMTPGSVRRWWIGATKLTAMSEHFDLESAEPSPQHRYINAICFSFLLEGKPKKRVLRPIGDETGQWQEVNGGPYAPGPGRPNKRPCLFSFSYFALFMFLSNSCYWLIVIIFDPNRINTNIFRTFRFVLTF
jgi:hypothetical protein